MATFVADFIIVNTGRKAKQAQGRKEKRHGGRRGGNKRELDAVKALGRQVEREKRRGKKS